ncbi:MULTISPECIES: hypothetical protein [Burkholderia]|uniref:hypothetical protein n=1 Tax=Burkholderia TaxID=32008 RepID=UPI000F5A62B4|nr:MULTISPECIES: hypothetical protein [Burkholderia]QRR16530.1 hypothetical protein GJG85_24595 [Burkholderia sp. MS389]QVN13901.1 hypothetical protein JYG37_25900 [Burkholderia sp. LAS2]
MTLDPGRVPTIFNLNPAPARDGAVRGGLRLYEAATNSRRIGALMHRITLRRTCLRRGGGETLDGKSLIVWPEQGLGDVVQFARYLPMLKRRGLATLTVSVPSCADAPVASVDRVDRCVTLGDVATLPAHDYACRIMSLPMLCETTVDTIPATFPYLHVPAPLVER